MANVLTFAKQDFKARTADAAGLMRVLANERRLMILCHLEDTELSVGDIQKHLGLSQSALSQHLAILREHKIVSTRREAQTIYYHISNPDVIKIITTLADIYCDP